MQITLTLPDPVVTQLERQAVQLNLSLDDLALKLFSTALFSEPVAATPIIGNRAQAVSSLAALVATIQATPPNPAMIVPPSQTMQEVVAYWQANPAQESDIAPNEWDRLWADFEQELKRTDHIDAIAEGRL